MVIPRVVFLSVFAMGCGGATTPKAIDATEGSWVEIKTKGGASTSGELYARDGSQLVIDTHAVGFVPIEEREIASMRVFDPLPPPTKPGAARNTTTTAFFVSGGLAFGTSIVCLLGALGVQASHRPPSTGWDFGLHWDGCDYSGEACPALLAFAGINAFLGVGGFVAGALLRKTWVVRDVLR